MNPNPSDIAAEYAALFPDHGPSPLLELPALAQHCGVARVFIKDEGARPYGNFKILGGMLAGLRLLARRGGVDSIQALLTRTTPVSLPTLLCASDGNHGLAVALAAQRAGTTARIFLPNAVSAQRAERIRACGADIVWIDGTYDDAVNAAGEAARESGSLLVADTGARIDDPVVQQVMAGYGLVLHELRRQFHDADARATHAFVQAGVGGLAAAVADGMRDISSPPGRLLVVEPEAAACVAQALVHGQAVQVPGDLHTVADMLSCGVASAPAIPVLRQYGAKAVAVDEALLRHAVEVLYAAHGPRATPSGAAGLAGLLHVAGQPDLRDEHALQHDSHVLLIVTERPISGLDGHRPLPRRRNRNAIRASARKV
ncbi:pyridoxal-phosphate dependent enzyme [Montanilutibacter psychrotolerans]|uniref:Pyridoxal-phosphate dependent enzyme n=1 Tax=Montanilutibacter psychrotolerans TaxID=1327343 RepID=A0A3M8SZR3_9GAMM|nr:pyridoxal-phosphate dependent enzyme [Lysobacter psychrotolerans]RNF86263.1 pyridoxal-phosphate dependent enzyme [Lysobacter psychrotolerans]